jgi:hypothetical protein
MMKMRLHWLAASRFPLRHLSPQRHNQPPKKLEPDGPSKTLLIASNANSGGLPGLPFKLVLHLTLLSHGYQRFFRSHCKS